MDALGWDHEAARAAPVAPTTIENTRARYLEAYETITGLDFDDWCDD